MVPSLKEKKKSLNEKSEWGRRPGAADHLPERDRVTGQIANPSAFPRASRNIPGFSGLAVKFLNFLSVKRKLRAWIHGGETLKYWDDQGCSEEVIAFKLDKKKGF